MPFQQTTRKAAQHETSKPPTTSTTDENSEGSDRLIRAAYERIKAAFERATNP